MHALRNDSDSRKESRVLDVESEDLVRAMVQGLDLPLAALRVSLEALRTTYSVGEPRYRIVDGALAEIRRLGRNVKSLLDFAHPPVPRPLRCTIEEIVLGARNGLAEEHRRRVIFARSRRLSSILVDGPLLGINLLRLMENSIEAGAERILVAVQQRGGATRFSVTDDAPEDFDAEWALAAFQTTKKNRLGLGLSLSSRDVGLLGGTLVVRRSPRGGTCVVVTVPDRAPVEAAA